MIFKNLCVLVLWTKVASAISSYFSVKYHSILSSYLLLISVLDVIIFIFLIYSSVKTSYPEETGNVDGRLREIQDLWNDLKVSNH